MSELNIKPSDFTFEDRRGRPKAENPYNVAVETSWGARPEGAKLGQPMEVILKNDKEVGKTGQPKNVVKAIGQIREAAAGQGLGVRIETRAVTRRGRGYIADDSGEATHTAIYFAAKERMVRGRRQLDESA